MPQTMRPDGAGVRQFVPRLATWCVVALAGLGGGVLLPRPAAACQACVCALPQSSAPMEFVPRNARVLVRGAPTDRFVLRSNVDPVALETQPSSVLGWVWVSARELLSVGVVYRIEPEDTTATTTQPLSIKVLDLEDHGPPTAAGVTIAPLTATASCKSSVAAGLNVGWLLDPEDTRGLGVYYAQLDVTIDGATESTILRMRSGARVLGEFGRDDCNYVTPVANARTGVAASARVTFYDQAGNATVAGPIDFEFGEAGTIPCPMGTGHAGAPGTGSAGAPGASTVPPSNPPLTVARAPEHVESCGVARGRRSTATIGLLLLAACALVQRRRFTVRRARRGSSRSRRPS